VRTSLSKEFFEEGKEERFVSKPGMVKIKMKISGDWPDNGFV